jgi:hypothetical protein
MPRKILTTIGAINLATITLAFALTNPYLSTIGSIAIIIAANVLYSLDHKQGEQ